MRLVQPQSPFEWERRYFRERVPKDLPVGLRFQQEYLHFQCRLEVQILCWACRQELGNCLLMCLYPLK